MCYNLCSVLHRLFLILRSSIMIKRILKFLGFGILGFIIIICFFGDQIMYFFDNNKYLNEVLYVKFGRGTTIIVGLIILFIFSFLFFKLLIWIIKTIYNTNEKYSIVVAYDWKDFLASWGIVLSIWCIISLIIKFESNMIVPTILCFIAGIFGIVNYKNRMEIINQLKYNGFSAFWRLITTFLFGIISYPFFILGLIFHTILGMPSMLDVVGEMSNNSDFESGYVSDGNGNITAYSKIKNLDSKGNVTSEHVHYKDDDGKDHDIFVSKLYFLLFN